MLKTFALLEVYSTGRGSFEALVGWKDRCLGENNILPKGLKFKSISRETGLLSPAGKHPLSGRQYAEKFTIITYTILKLHINKIPTTSMGGKKRSKKLKDNLIFKQSKTFLQGVNK